MLKLAIIGTGIAGMGCAHFLQSRFDLTPRPLDCGDLSPLSAGDSSPSKHRTRPAFLSSPRTLHPRSCGAATESSPRREPWVNRPRQTKPRQGRQNPSCLAPSPLSPLPGLSSVSYRPHGSRRGLLSAATPWLGFRQTNGGKRIPLLHSPAPIPLPASLVVLPKSLGSLPA